MMEDGLLSMKWNNHRSSFLYTLSVLREKNTYTDVTLVCDGEFFYVHKLVMSTCSDYFTEIFEKTQCKNPVIVLKDIKKTDLEALLDYMYIGEVDVKQSELSGIIKAAECLRIKGLAVQDEDPSKISSSSSNNKKLTSSNNVPDRRSSPPPAKRHRKDSGSEVKSGGSGGDDCGISSSSLSQSTLPSSSLSSSLLSTSSLRHTSSSSSSSLLLSSAISSHQQQQSLSADSSSNNNNNNNHNHNNNDDNSRFSLANTPESSKVSYHHPASLVYNNNNNNNNNNNRIIPVKVEQRNTHNTEIQSDVGIDGPSPSVDPNKLTNNDDRDDDSDDNDGLIIDFHQYPTQEIEKQQTNHNMDAYYLEQHKSTPGPSGLQEGSEVLCWGDAEEEEVFQRSLFEGNNNNNNNNNNNTSINQHMYQGNEHSSVMIDRKVSFNTSTDREPSMIISSVKTLEEEGRRYACDHCSFTSKFKSGIVCHLRTHNNDKPYARTHNNDKPYARTHNNDKPYACDQCCYVTRQKGALTAHSLIHTNEKPYTCDKCSFASKHKGNLTAHMLTHTQEKPYICQQCPFSTKWRSNLSSHMRMHLQF